MLGHKSDEFEPETWEAMVYGALRKEELDYLKLTVVVSAILTAGRIAGGGEPGDSLKTSLQGYRGALFPEIKSDLLAKAKQNEKILEQEFTKGPLKVKPLDYGTKRKKNR